MRKVTYTINDYKTFLQIYGSAVIKDIMKPSEAFKCRVVLTAESDDAKTPDHYRIEDMDGNKISRDSLNGYQKAIVIGDCYKHFAGEEPKRYYMFVDAAEVIE